MDLLVLILDLNPTEWGKRGTFPLTTTKPEPNTSASSLPPLPASASFTSVLSQLIIFLSAFLLLSQHNQLAVIAAHPDTAQYIFPSQRARHRQAGDATDSRMAVDGEEKEEKANSQPHQSAPLLSSATLSTALPEAIQALLATHTATTTTTTSSSSPPLLAGALSLALCHINRATRHHAASTGGATSGGRLRARVMCVSVSSDSSGSYIAMMNSIFSAHKLAVPIDSLVLHTNHSLFLQQAASLTTGLYLHLPPTPTTTAASLLQHLLLTFLPDPLSRAHLLLPRPAAIDYRATCFCHRRVVEQAMVCPVCLAIYCKATPTCGMCKSGFMAQHVRVMPAGGGGGVRGGVLGVGGVKKEERKEEAKRMAVDDKEEKR